MVLSTTNGATLAICVLVLVMVWWLDLYRKTVYRLALYQVLAALEVAAVLVAQIQFLNYDSGSTFDRLMCVTTAYFFLPSVAVDQTPPRRVCHHPPLLLCRLPQEPEEI